MLFPSFSANDPFRGSPRGEIASWMVDFKPRRNRGGKGRVATRIDTQDALVGQVAAEIRSRQVEIAIGALSHRSRRRKGCQLRQYYWTEKSDQDEVNEAEESDADTDSQRTVASPREIDLYPLLSEYLLSELQVYSMRIDDKKSQNKLGRGGNKWLHPDLAGMEDLTDGWHDQISRIYLRSIWGQEGYRLWSFEVKKLLNRSTCKSGFLSDSFEFFIGPND